MVDERHDAIISASEPTRHPSDTKVREADIGSNRQPYPKTNLRARLSGRESAVSTGGACPDPHGGRSSLTVRGRIPVLGVGAAVGGM